MDRKSAIAAAGTVALTLTATGVAIAANMGLLNQKANSDLGLLSASVPPPAMAETATGAQPDPEVVTIYQDIPVPARSASAGQVPVAGGFAEDSALPSYGTTNPAATGDPGQSVDEHGDDDLEVEDEDREDEDHADEDHQTEDHSEEDNEHESESEDDDD